MEEKKEEKESERKKKQTLLDKSIDFIFSNDERKWLIPIFVLGVILRFIVARNISMLGDEAVHGPHAIGFLHSGLISTFAHSPTWFYLTDIFMRILGVTMFSTRFLSFFYGSLTILVVYILTARIFSKKAALLSSFLLAVSYYLIRYTLAEMDLSALFFLTFAIYIFIVSAEKGKFPYLAAVSIGIASLIKTLSLFFVPAFLLAFFLFRKKEENKLNKKEFWNLSKRAVYFGLIILLVFSPILIHNYLWYKDKGMVDTYFAQYFDIGNARQAYTGLLGFDSGFLEQKFFDGVVSMAETIFRLDPVIVLFGLLGLLMTYFLREKRKYWLFLIIFNLFGFIFLILSNWLPTHYATMIPFLAIFGGVFIDKFSLKIGESFKMERKIILTILVIAILIFQLFMLMPHLSSRGALSQMREYAINNVDKDSVVLVDSRIYRGRIAWLFSDFHYLEASYFSPILQLNENLSGQDIPIKLYFIECARDDCGWGTIKDNPQLNESMEQLVGQFSGATPQKTILGGGGYDEETGDPYFKVYQTQINLKPQIISVIDSTHEWFYYPVNYIPKEKIFDRYNVNGFFNGVIYKFAWLVIILSIILALIFPIKLGRDLIKDL